MLEVRMVKLAQVQNIIVLKRTFKVFFRRHFLLLDK